MMTLSIVCLACLIVFLEMAGRALSEEADARVDARSAEPRSVVDAQH